MNPSSPFAALAFIVAAIAGLAPSPIRAQSGEPGCRPEMARLGLPVNEMQTAAANGFLVMARPTNYSKVKPDDVKAMFDRIDQAGAAVDREASGQIPRVS